MRALLDVNVLIALLDASHVHHRLATNWLTRNIRHGWASCPITQIGCIRVMSQAAYPNARSPAEVAERLRAAAEDRYHEFWAADTDVLAEKPINWSAMLSARHITDAWLLALAVQRDGRFVTFDRRVPLAAVAGAEARHLEVIE
jgi:uncharacterized protein